MQKKELIDRVSKKTGQNKDSIKSLVDTVFDTISESLINGEEIRFIGFGTFSITERKARTGRNPSSGEEIEIPASKQVKFKAGKNLKEAINS